MMQRNALCQKGSFTLLCLIYFCALKHLELQRMLPGMLYLALWFYFEASRLDGTPRYSSAILSLCLALVVCWLRQPGLAPRATGS
jgi:hypothetical protein